MKNSIQALRKKWYLPWLDRRIPPAKEVELNRKRIFIFPSKFGFAFCFLMLVMLVLAINYQNNMAYLLVFFMASLFFVTLHHSYNNLSGLCFSIKANASVHAEDEQIFAVRAVSRSKLERFNIFVKFPLSDAACFDVNLASKNVTEVSLSHSTFKRGILKPGRLLIESDYPLGLFRVWSWVDLKTQAIIYPKLLAAPLSDSDNDQQGESFTPTISATGDEFYQLRGFRQGDNTKHIHWRHYAKSQQLTTQQFAKSVSEAKHLDWYSLTGSTEEKLSVMAYWAILFEREQHAYSLILPNKTIAKNHGQQHLNEVLTNLALYGENVADLSL